MDQRKERLLALLDEAEDLAEELGIDPAELDVEGEESPDSNIEDDSEEDV